MYMYMYTHIYLSLYIYIYIYIYIIYTYTMSYESLEGLHPLVEVCALRVLLLHPLVTGLTGVDERVVLDMCVHIYIYIYMSIYMCIYMHIIH